MGKVSKILCETQSGFAHWCPGCKTLHIFTTKQVQRNGARWQFDGNLDRPTFNPSMLISTGRNHIVGDAQVRWETECHYWLRGGRIEFLMDSDHELKGKTVDVPDLPAEYDEFDNHNL